MSRFNDIKFKYQTETRRLRLSDEQFQSISFEALSDLAIKLFPSLTQLGSDIAFTLRWIDEEGDSVSLSSSAELFLALQSMSTGDRVCRFEIIVTAAEVEGEGGKKKTTATTSTTATTDAAATTTDATSTNPLPVHEGVECDECEKKPIVGVRFKCTQREDYDLCDSCELKQPQPFPMIKIYNPEQSQNTLFASVDIAAHGLPEGVQHLLRGAARHVPHYQQHHNGGHHNQHHYQHHHGGYHNGGRHGGGGHHHHGGRGGGGGGGGRGRFGCPRRGGYGTSTDTDCWGEKPTAGTGNGESNGETPQTQQKSPIGDLPVHALIFCDECDMKPITGTRYKCTVRDDYDLCAACESKNPQPFPMIEISNPQQSEESTVFVNFGGFKNEAYTKPGALPIHTHVRCDECGMKPITGTRYNCTQRNNFDLCESCKNKQVQPFPMIKLYNPEQSQSTMFASTVDIAAHDLPESWQRNVHHNGYGYGHHGGHGRRGGQRKECEKSAGESGINWSPASNIVNSFVHSTSSSTSLPSNEPNTSIGSTSDAVKPTVPSKFIAAMDLNYAPVASETVVAAKTEEGAVPSDVMVDTTTTTTTTSSSSPSSSSSTSDVVAEPPRLFARLLGDVTYPRETTVAPNTRFNKVWLVRNDGNVSWSVGSYLTFDEGDKLCPINIKQPVPLAEVGKEVEVSISLMAPHVAGSYVSHFRFMTADGTQFGHRLWVEIRVEEEEENGWHILSVSNASNDSYSSSCSASSSAGSDSAKINNDEEACCSSSNSENNTVPVLSTSAVTSDEISNVENKNSGKILVIDATLAAAPEVGNNSDTISTTTTTAPVAESTSNCKISFASVQQSAAIKSWEWELGQLAGMGFYFNESIIPLLVKHLKFPACIEGQRRSERLAPVINELIDAV